MPHLRPPPGLTPAIPPDRLRADDLPSANLPARGSILAPLLRERSLNLLYAPRGLGKTFIALAMAHAAAAGEHFLAWRAERPRSVVYVDGEMAAVDLRDRLRALGPMPPSLEFIMADLRKDSLPDLATEEGQAAFAKAFDASPPDLVVLDNLSSLAGHRTGEADPWPKVQPFLLSLRRRMAVLVVHHTNKSGSLRGSAQHEDVLDLVIALRRPPDYKPQQGARFELHIEKARALAGHEVEPIEARLRIDATGRADWEWWPIEIQDSHRVTALMRNGRNPNQIARELGISKSKAYRLRGQMTDLSPE